MDQPGEVANPARGQLNRENKYSPVPVTRVRIWSRETGSAVPSRISLLILHTQAECDSIIWSFITFSRVQYGSTGYGCQSNSWSADQEKRSFSLLSPFAPSLAVPSRVGLLILHTQAESGAYSRDSARLDVVFYRKI